jgi:hypothetical protein
LNILSLVWGVLAFCGMFIGLIPCLGSLNWLNVPFALVGVLLSIIALATSRPGRSNAAIAGLILCLLATIFGVMRLHLGGGVL